MIVCVAEKPSVAREIAQVLGATLRKDGYFEGNGYQVTWTFGHLCTLKEPGDYLPHWKYWRLDLLPMIPHRFGIKVIDNAGVKKQFATIEKLFQGASQVINCGDAGQEGELIQRWVIQKAKCKSPVKRLWISSLTEDAIREGFLQLKDESQFTGLYEAGLARAIGDWVLGLNITRLYTLKYGQNRSVLSIGRVQTPTLALIVNRQLEIQNFQPQAYWELKTVCRETTFSASKGKFSSKEEGELFLSTIENALLEITDIITKKGEEFPPRLFDLTALQVECNKKLSLSAEQTLQIAQSLYEKKLITYPRVDTTFLSDDIYPKVSSILRGLSVYRQLIEPILAMPKILKSKKVFDNKKITDHHAIIPTGIFSHQLSADEKRVYDVIVRRFIAVFYPSCKMSSTTVLATVSKVDFKATGKQILDPGWRVVFEKEPQDNFSEDADGVKPEAVLAEFSIGERLEHVPSLAEKWTQPPKYYTEATLLRAMETAGKLVDNEDLRDVLKENGIGRPSTRANIIETLFKRNYIRKEKKSLYATQTGVQLIQTIDYELLKSAELTGLWENKLRQIERQEYGAKQFLDELKEMVHDIVLQVKKEQGKAIAIEAVCLSSTDSPSKKRVSAKSGKQKSASVGKKHPSASVGEPTISVAKVPTTCPLCGKGTVIKGKGAYGCSRWSEGCSYRLPFSK